MKHLKKSIYFFPLLICFLGYGFTAVGQSFTEAEKIFVTTDRHLYSPGERLHYTLFVVDEKHQIQKQSSMIKVVLVDGKDKSIDSLVAHVLTGRFSYFFNLPKTGGTYKIKASTRWQLNETKPTSFEKEIYVQDQIQRSFFISQDLNKTSYAAGDSVVSNVHLTKRGDDGIDGGRYSAYLLVNDQQVNQLDGWLDNQGKAAISFKLPEGNIESAYIKLQSEFQGVSEFSLERIPILTKDVSLVVHTVNGMDQLVAGVENRLVVSSFDNLGNPKDIKGNIVDHLGNVVASFESLYKGMAEVRFTPIKGVRYAARSNAAKEAADLPMVVENQPYVHVYEKGGMLIMEVRNNKNEAVQVQLSGNGEKVLHKILTPQPNQKIIAAQIALESLSAGVYGVQFTNLNNDIIGRQLYVRRPDNVLIEIEPDKDLVSLGQAVKLKINTNKEAASFAIRAISEQNVKQIKDKSHSIVSWMYLGTEFLTDIEEPKYYFDGQSVDAKKALELFCIAHLNQWKRDFNSGKLVQKESHYYPRVSSFFSGTIYQYNTRYQDREGIKVRIKNTNYVTLTDSLGKFEFSGIPTDVLSNNPVLIISKGVERQEYPIHHSYNFYKHGFTEALQPGMIGKTLQEIKKLEIRSTTFGTLRYKQPELKTSQNMLNTTEIQRDRKAYTIDATSVDLMSAPSRNLSSIVVQSYYWNFGDNRANYTLYDEKYHSYSQPFGITLDYNNRHNPVTYPGPIRLGDKTTYWYGEAESNHQGDFKSTFYTPFKNDGIVIFCEGVTASGKVFVSQKTITVQDEVEVFTNVPTTLTAGDYANVELRFINHSSAEKMVAYTTEVNQVKSNFNLTLSPNETKNVYVELMTGSKSTSLQFRYHHTFDQILRTSENFVIPILPKGHARNMVLSGSQSRASETFKVQEVIDGTAEIRLSVLNDFIDLLESTSKRMVRQPNGCFEQVSSSNYPNLLALKVLQHNADYASTTLINNIKLGYAKLAAYETPNNGFEWYGRNPPHTTLSAYGLLQFSLTRELGLQIDEQMFQRNLEWLLKQKDGDGGFRFHKGKYGFSGSDYKTNNAYVTWVLSRISNEKITREITAIETDLEQSFDAYKAALLAGTYINKGQFTQGKHWLSKLQEHFNQKKYTGFTTKGSIMYSGGRSLDVEIMALTLLAIHSLESTPDKFALKLISEIVGAQTNYGFGNTQSTALALEALSNYADYFVAKTAEQNYIVYIDEQEVIRLSPNVDHKRNVSLVLSQDWFKKGQHTLRVKCASEQQMPYTVELSWLEEVDKVEHPELVLDYTFSKGSITTNEELFANITLQNKTVYDKPQTVAVIRLPAGVSYNMEELKLLKKEGVFDYFETIEDKLIFYFLGLEALETKEIHLALKPNIIGRFSPSESFAYQYYTPEIRSSILAKPLHIKLDAGQ